MEINLINCTVRSFKIDDAPSLAFHANNKKIWLQLRDIFPYPYSEKDAEFFIDLSLKQKPERTFTIAVEDKAVGAIGLVLQQDIERFSAEIGYWLAEKYWGLGIISEALKAVTKFSMNAFKLNRLYALPFANNAGSARVLENAGYVLEGRLRESAYKNDRFEDQFIYAYLKS